MYKKFNLIAILQIIAIILTFIFVNNKIYLVPTSKKKNYIKKLFII